MSVVLLADPAEYPLTLAEAKTQCGVEGPDFDSELEVLLAAATGSLESFTGLSLARRRWRLVLDGWADAIELPRGPVRNVDAVRYFDATGFRRTLPQEIYSLDLAQRPQWLLRNASASWPALGVNVNGIEIDCDCGFGADCPAELKVAIKLLVHKLFEGCASSDAQALAETLAMPFRRILI